ncbi:4Fe-4S ferredoxin [Methanobacterium sp.]|uniref:4Fe-4S ferredoxin n=1 Tax=Methanobacterium sp. TaxID=2164 RepID=UPI003C713E6B
MELGDNIRTIIEESCEDYFLGEADLSLPDQIVTEPYTSLIAIYPRAISIGITLPQNITKERLIDGNLNYDEFNCKINYITSNLCELLVYGGYKALAVPKSGNIKDQIFRSLHYMAASKADLGWIEKNMFITPEVGMGVNWGTVLTDAPLDIICPNL